MRILKKLICTVLCILMVVLSVIPVFAESTAAAGQYSGKSIADLHANNQLALWEIFKGMGGADFTLYDYISGQGYKETNTTINFYDFLKENKVMFSYGFDNAENKMHSWFDAFVIKDNVTFNGVSIDNLPNGEKGFAFNTSIDTSSSNIFSIRYRFRREENGNLTVQRDLTTNALKSFSYRDESYFRMGYFNISQNSYRSFYWNFMPNGCSGILDNYIIGPDDLGPYKLKFNMSDVSVNIPENVPFLGGSKIDMDFDSKIPIGVTFKGDALRLTIGLDECKTEEDWTSLKRAVMGDSKRLPTGGNVSKTKYGTTKVFGTDFDISVYGYAEAKFTNGRIDDLKEISGNVVIQMSASLQRQWQTFVFSVPVVIKCKGSVAVDQGISLGYNFTDKQLHLSGDTQLTLPKIRASAGVGIVFVGDVSLYGEAANTLTLKYPETSFKAALSGEFGASATLLNQSQDFAICSGTWEYYNSENLRSASANKLQGLQDPGKFKIDRSYLENQSDWLGERSAQTRATAPTVKTLQENIYSDATPKLVTTPNGTTMMVWTYDVASRPDGNHTAVVYSIYSKMFDSWSPPQIVANDGTADFYPDVTAVGNDIYVTWVNANKVVASNITVADMAKTCEIAVAKFDGEEGSFERAVNLTSNSTLDISPSIATVNGQPYVTWINNSNSDLFTQKGTNTVYYAQVSNPASVTVQQYVSATTPIVSADIGALGGNVNIVYEKDTDGDLSTTNDMELYGGKTGTAPARITNNTAYEQSPQFANLGGQDVLLWYSDSNLYQTQNLTNISTLFSEKDASINADFSVVSGNTNEAIVCTSDSEKGSSVYAFLNNGGTWSKSVPVTNADGYVKYANGYFDKSNNLNIVYTRTDAQVGNNTVTRKTDLCISSVAKDHNITLDRAEYDEYKATLGTVLPVDLSITNNGLVKESGFKIVVSNGSTEYYSTTVQQDLEIGENGTVHFELPLPSVFTGLTNYTVKVLPLSGTDSDLTDNNCTVSIGYPDLQISLKETKVINGSNITATVVNNGLSYTYGKLHIRKGAPDGEILKEYNIQPLGAGVSTTRNVTAKELSEFASDGDMLYFEVTSDKSEEFTGDNNDFIVANIKYILGDVDGDGAVSTADTLMIQKYQSSQVLLDAIQKQAADVNQDGAINTADILLLQKYLSSQLPDTQIGKEQSYIKK